MAKFVRTRLMTPKIMASLGFLSRYHYSDMRKANSFMAVAIGSIPKETMLSSQEKEWGGRFRLGPGD